MNKKLERLCHAIAWARASTISQRRETPAEAFDVSDEQDEIRDEAAEVLRALRGVGLKLDVAPLPARKKATKFDPSKPTLCINCNVAHPNYETAKRLCGGKTCLPRTPADAMCDGEHFGPRCKRKVVVVIPASELEAADGFPGYAWCEKHRPKPTVAT